jgi:hypothetical protein
MFAAVSVPIPSARVFFRLARWLIAMATMTTIQPETYGSTVQLNTDQDSAKRNFFHNSASRDPDQEGSPCFGSSFHFDARGGWGCYFFVLTDRNHPGEIRGFFIAFAWQVRGKDASGGQMRGKLLMFFDKCEILQNPL